MNTDHLGNRQGSCVRLAILAAFAAAGLYGQGARADMVELFSYAGPTPVNGLSTGVTAIAAGNDQNIVVQNGGVYAWGRNFYGQLGDGTTTDHSTPAPVTGLSGGVTAIATGLDFNLAVKDGGVYAWGYNASGQLGDGTTTTRKTPVPVTGLSSGVTAITAGDSNSVAVQNGALFAWGAFTGSAKPVAVSGFSAGVTAIAAGSQANLVVQNGALFAWGINEYGEVGDGTTTWRFAPVPVSGLSSGVTAIAAGTDHSLAVQNGGVYAWGFNFMGQLGDGTQNDRLTPERIDATDLTNIIAVAACQDGSYALSADGTLWVWGTNSEGELGLPVVGGLNEYLTPQRLLPPTGYIFTGISASDEFSGGADHILATLAPVPEPASLSLLALGGIALLARRRRRDEERT